MAHTAQLEMNGKYSTWIVKDGNGEKVTETIIPLDTNIARILSLLDAGEKIENILFPGIEWK